jgi:uncharacterized protein
MKLRLSFFISTLFLSVLFIGLQSCKSSSAVAKAPKVEQTKKLDNALLWEVTGKDITKPSYVFGTIHMIDAKEFFLPNGLLAAVDQSQKMYFEIDMKMMNDMGAMMGLMNKLFMRDGLTLKDLYSEAEYAEIKEFFKSKGLPLMFLERMKPMFLSALAYIDIGPGGLKDSDKVKSYEFELNDIAEDKKMATGGLETIEFQISVFDSIPYKEQAAMLLNTIKAGSVDNQEMKLMVSMYKNQEIEKMAELSIGDEKDNLAKYNDLLLKKRNENWIPTMKEEMKKQATIFAVGAAHLAGKDGVLTLLKKEGYTLKPVSKVK